MADGSNLAAVNHVVELTPSTPNAYFMPGADPGEGYKATNDQLWGTDTSFSKSVSFPLLYTHGKGTDLSGASRAGTLPATRDAGERFLRHGQSPAPPHPSAPGSAVATATGVIVS